MAALRIRKMSFILLIYCIVKSEGNGNYGWHGEASSSDLFW